MRLTIVGMAGSFPGPDSPASCYLVEADDADGRTWRVLLDLGSGALGPLHRYVDPASLDAILLSHLHPDHCLDLTGLYVVLRYRPGAARSERLPVYGPTGTAARLAAAYGSEEGHQLESVYEVREWADGRAEPVGPLSVLPMLVEHPVEAYGMRIEHRTGGRTAVLTYSGDTDACPNLTRLAKGADVLLAEAAFVEGRDGARGIHLTGRRAGETAAAAGVRRLLLTHLPVWNDPQVAHAQAREVFDSEIGVVRAGDAYEI